MSKARSLFPSIDNLLNDPLIRAVMTADRVDEDDLRMMLEDIAQTRRLALPARPAVVPGVISIGDHTPGYRRGVGMIILNPDGKVFIGRRRDIATIETDLTTAWQFPQGGIELGETPHIAALRELREEIGTDNVDIIAESRNWFRYDLPMPLRRTTPGHLRLGQEQKWFLMRYLGDDSDIDIFTEHPEFSAWQWTNPETIPDMVIQFKRALYREVMSELAPSPSGRGRAAQDRG
jgi:putative (di)nucleoside polyphosphate hydrolase